MKMYEVNRSFTHKGKLIEPGQIIEITAGMAERLERLTEDEEKRPLREIPERERLSKQLDAINFD
jgi:hypothetical protein